MQDYSFSQTWKSWQLSSWSSVQQYYISASYTLTWLRTGWSWDRISANARLFLYPNLDKLTGVKLVFSPAVLHFSFIHSDLAKNWMVLRSNRGRYKIIPLSKTYGKVWSQPSLLFSVPHGNKSRGLKRAGEWGWYLFETPAGRNLSEDYQIL